MSQVITNCRKYILYCKYHLYFKGKIFFKDLYHYFSRSTLPLQESSLSVFFFYWFFSYMCKSGYSYMCANKNLDYMWVSVISAIRFLTIASSWMSQTICDTLRLYYQQRISTLTHQLRSTPKDLDAAKTSQFLGFLFLFLYRHYFY